MKYGWIESLRREYPICAMCRTVGVSESGYYAWKMHPPSRRASEEARLETEIRAAHQRTRQTCGPERLKADLADHGVHRIKRIRRKLGLRCRQKRRFKATTDSKHSLPVAPNRLDRQFAVAAPNKAWVTDITSIETDEDWLYLAGVKDLFNGEIVGYAMDERMTRSLVMQALFRAVVLRRPDKGLLHHSDRGSQYCSRDYQSLLEQFGMQASMSRKANCWDNAPMESFWGTLKTELVHHRRFASREQARQEIPSTSKSSITGSESRLGWATCHRHPSGSSTTRNR